MKIRKSPNFDDRPAGSAVDILLLHYTGMRSAEEALTRMCSAEAKVSSHYMVDEDGAVISLVDEEARAWHAGVASWHGDCDINGRSIGIEIVNPGHEFGYRPFPDVQIEAVMSLGQEILQRHDISAERVLGHSDVAPMRKQDPGELFPWDRLAARGIGRFIEPGSVAPGAEITPAELQRRFKSFGYGVGITGEIDPLTEAVIGAFQRHFRPARFDGVADPETMGLLKAYLTARS